MREHAGVYSRGKRRYLCCTKRKGMLRDEKSGTLVTLLCAMAIATWRTCFLEPEVLWGSLQAKPVNNFLPGLSVRVTAVLVDNVISMAPPAQHNQTRRVGLKMCVSANTLQVLEVPRGNWTNALPCARLNFASVELQHKEREL